MKAFILIAVVVFTLVSCKKSEPGGVMVRIENSTTYTLDSLKLRYDTSNYNYGTILSGNISSYHLFKTMSDDPAVLGKSGNNIFIAGPIIPPNSYPNSTLSNGKYTLKIFPDSSLFYGYNAKFIKD